MITAAAVCELLKKHVYWVIWVFLFFFSFLLLLALNSYYITEWKSIWISFSMFFMSCKFVNGHVGSHWCLHKCFTTSVDFQNRDPTLWIDAKKHRALFLNIDITITGIEDMYYLAGPWGGTGQLAEHWACSRLWCELVLKQCSLFTPGFFYACTVQQCRKLEDAVIFFLHSTHSNTPHKCCQISAKLNNSIIPP